MMASSIRPTLASPKCIALAAFLLARTGVLMLALAFGGPTAFAQGLIAYAGVAIGEFDHRNETPSPFSDSVSSWKIYGGVELTKYFGLELTYGSPSAIDAEDPGAPLSVATRRFNAARRMDLDLTTFKLMGHLPLGRFDLWLGYGSVYMDADVDFSTFTGGVGSVSFSDSREFKALGVDWRAGNLNPLAVRLEYEKLDFPFSDASTISIGIGYRFEDL